MSSLMPDLSEEDDAIFGVFVTALEGGIGYWSTCTTYKWDGMGNGYYAEVFDHEDMDGGVPKILRIDRDLILKGVKEAREKWVGDRMDYHARAIRLMAEGFWTSIDLDYDADTADLIVQHGLFGEAVYG